jgi:hypothetical protein
MNQTNGFGAVTPISQSLKSKKLTFSKHGQIEIDAFTLLGDGAAQNFSPKNARIRQVEKS